MSRRIPTFTVIAVGVLAAGGAAFAVANSVSTKPEPAFISHLDKSIQDHPTPTTVDHRGNDEVTSPTTHDSTPATVDDHGNDEAATHDSTPTTVDDHGDDTTATTPTTVDDRGHDPIDREADGSGSGSRHSGGVDDNSGSNDG